MRVWGLIILLLLPLASASIEETIYEKGEAEVIIIFKETKGQLSYSTASTLLPGFKQHGIINGYSGTLTKEKLKELEGADVLIFEDRTFHLHPDGGITGNVSVPAIGADYVQQTLNVTGRNITISVIDSGINYNHSDLGGCLGAGCKVKGGFDFVNNDSNPADDNGHGTHVAGIIAANGSLTGVAPNALLLAAKACDSDGDCVESDVIDALNWSVTQNASVISMSLGGSVSSTILGAGGSAMALAVENAVSQGVVVVISAGNDGSGVSTINTPGDAPSAITVGNANDGGTISITDDVIAGTSSRGPGLFGRLKPDISAPGTSINSTHLSGYAVLSGTSMAAPHVSGVVALLLEQNENLTPQQIRAIIINTASNYSAEVFEKGAGLVNAKEAVMYDAYALVNASNSYGQQAYTDRWELVAYQNESTNITFVNLNNVSVNYSITLDGLTSLESGHSIGTESFSFPTNLVVNVSSNETLNINFSLNTTVNISSYAGLLRLEHNYTNVNMSNVTIPIVVSVPAEYTHFGKKSMTSSGTKPGDVLTYAYYNPSAGNDEVYINWSSSSNDLDLYTYNSTGSINVYNGSANTDNERVTSTASTTIKWIRVHGFSFSGSPFNFWLNITDMDNNAPNITLINNQSSFNFTYTILDNITMNVTVIDDDTVNVTMNDSRFTFSGTVGNNSVFWMNNKTVGNHTFSVTAIDLYNVTTTEVINLTVTAFNETLIDGYSPSNLSQLLKKNDTINFTQNSSGTAIWYVNGTNVSNESSFLFNSSLYNVSTYNITVQATGNITNGTHNITTNESVSWIVDLRAANVAVYFNSSNNISNFSWNEGSNLSNAINLSEHFIDDDNDTLTYALVNASNITMSVTNSTASFIVPDENYFGTERVWIVATDYNANATSNTFTLTVNEVAPVDNGGGSSGGGSGGGGSSAVISAPSEETTPRVTYAKVFSVVEESVTVLPNSEDISIEEVVIAVEGTHTNVLIKVEKYEEDPEEAEEFERKRYEVLEIEHPDLADEDITDVDLTFTVDMSWLEENDLDPDRISLYRYTEEWDELETALVSTNSIEATYTATSPGLSTFIIGEKEVVAIQKEFEEPEFSIHKEVEEPEIPTTPQIPEVEQPAEVTKESDIALIIVLVVVIVIVLVGGFMLLKKR